MKLFFFDLETTGVMHWKNGIHQLSGQIQIGDMVVDSFDIRVQPNPKCVIEESALKASNVTAEIVNAYQPMITGYYFLVNLLGKYCDKFNKDDKFFLVGYNNAAFDNAFLRAFFVQNGDNYFGSWFWSNSIDVMVLAAEYLKTERHKMADFKLKTVAAYLGIPVEESRLHDAQYDIELTRSIYQIITKK